jgi:energy-coupling factor transport system permease protein
MHSIYVPGSSFLHRLYPLTKLVAALLVIVISYTLPFLWMPPVLFALLAALAAMAGVLPVFMRAVARVVLPIVLSLFLIQGILFPPAGATPLPLGPVTLTREGLLFAYSISARLLVFAAAILLVLQTTHPADLVFSLTKLGLPRSVGHLLLVSFQVLPDMSARATAILEAQRSRGLETQRGLARFTALVPLISPLVIGALADVEERALALESRAFFVEGPKTTLRDVPDTPVERAARWLMVLASVGLIVARIVMR